MTPFLSRLAPGWDLIESSGWKDYIFLNFRFISKVTKSGFDWRDHSAENKISKVDYTPFCARPQKSPFGLPICHAEGECFAPCIINEAPSQRPEDNLYEYCALAQKICGFWDDFVGSYGSEGVFFERRQFFRLGSFSMSSCGK